MRDLCIDGREGMSAIMNEKLLKHSILLSAAVSVILGAAAAFLFLGEGDSFMEGVIVCLMIGIFAIYPFILTLINFAADPEGASFRVDHPCAGGVVFPFAPGLYGFYVF